MTDKAIMEFFEPMVLDSKMLPGFRCPVKVLRGPNWLDCDKIGAVL